MSLIYRLIVFITLSQFAMAQDDPCNYVDSLSHSSCASSDTVKTPSLNSSKWKHLYSNEWQFVCFSPNQETNLSNSKFFQVFQLNSILSESIRYKSPKNIFALKLQDELLLEFIADSTLTTNRDLSQLNFSFAKANELEKFNPYCALGLESQKFIKYQLLADSSGKQIKIKESSFLSPGTFLIQTGMKFRLSTKNEIHLGLASAKLKWIRDKSIFVSLKTDEIQGVQRDVKPKPDGGFALNGDFENQLVKDLKIEQSCRIFYPFYNKKAMDIEFRNKLSFMLSKHVKSSILTTYSYSESRWPPSFWRAEFRIGYALEN